MQKLLAGISSTGSSQVMPQEVSVFPMLASSLQLMHIECCCFREGLLDISFASDCYCHRERTKCSDVVTFDYDWVIIIVVVLQTS